MTIAQLMELLSLRLWRWLMRRENTAGSRAVVMRLWRLEHEIEALPGQMLHARYVGPNEELWGHTALLRPDHAEDDGTPMVLAQFDTFEEMMHGWYLFPETFFRPSDVTMRGPGDD